MVGTINPKTNIEPTPEFNERCMNVLHRWEEGEITFKEAVAQFALMAQEATTEANPVHQGRVEQLLSYIQHYRGNLDASIHHNTRARNFYAKAGNERRVAITDLNQGENYRFKGDFARAVRLFQSAQNTASTLEDLTTQTIATVNEGLVLVTLEQDAEAKRVLEDGYRLAQQWENKDRSHRRMMTEIYHGMAVLALRAGNPEKAWERAVTALESAKDDGDPVLRGYAFRTMGDVITALGEAPDDAYSSDPDDYFRESLNAFRELNAEAEMARTMFAQALSQAQRGRRNNAARKMQHVMTIFTQLGMVHDAARAAEAQLEMT